MLQFEELRLGLLALTEELENLCEAMDIAHNRQRLADLEEQTAAEGFWNDQENSQKVVREMSHIKGILRAYEKLQTAYDDTLTLVELAIEMGDESVYDEAKQGYDFVVADLETQKLATLLSGEYDGNNAILTFHAGAGGTASSTKFWTIWTGTRPG